MLDNSKRERETVKICNVEIQKFKKKKEILKSKFISLSWMILCPKDKKEDLGRIGQCNSGHVISKLRLGREGEAQKGQDLDRG